MYSQSDDGHFKTQMMPTVLGCAITGWQLEVEEQLPILINIKLTHLTKDSWEGEQGHRHKAASRHISHIQVIGHQMRK